ncbi:WD40 repeat domain-containing protein [Luedemannella flava]
MGGDLTVHRGLFATGGIVEVAVGVVDGRTVAVSASTGSPFLDKEPNRVWALATGRQVRTLPDRVSQPTAIDVAEVAGVPVAVVAGTNGTLQMWDLRTGKPRGDPLRVHRGYVTDLATGTLDGRAVAVTIGDDRTLKVWDLRTGKPVGTPVTSETGLSALTLTTLAGRPVAITGGDRDDGALRVWDLQAVSRSAPPWHGTTSGWVTSPRRRSRAGRSRRRSATTERCGCGIWSRGGRSAIRSRLAAESCGRWRSRSWTAGPSR